MLRIVEGGWEIGHCVGTPADYPIFWHKADIWRTVINVHFQGKADVTMHRDQ